MTADRHVMVGVLLYLAAVAGPTLVILAAVRLVPVVFGLLESWLHRLAAWSPALLPLGVRARLPVRLLARLPSSGRPGPPGRPRQAGRAGEGASFEHTVRDLHRLRAELLGPPQGTHVRRVALLAAYDDVLLTLCRQVGIDAGPLRGAAEVEKAFARLQAEAAVEAAGVTLDPPRAGPAAA